MSCGCRMQNTGTIVAWYVAYRYQGYCRRAFLFFGNPIRIRGTDTSNTSSYTNARAVSFLPVGYHRGIKLKMNVGATCRLRRLN
eukprot:scaffold4582_cov56-Attheya_sp.AAC.2